MTAPIEIREAEARDLVAVRALVESAYRGDSARRGWTHEADLLDGQRTDVALLGAIVEDRARHRILIALASEALIGCVHVSAKGGGRAHLGMLSVDPALQAGGLGRRLIAAAEACARETFGCAAMEMTVIKRRVELIAYYERRGYRLTGREEPFPLDDPRFGLPKTRDLVFVVLEKTLG